MIVLKQLIPQCVWCIAVIITLHSSLPSAAPRSKPLKNVHDCLIEPRVIVNVGSSAQGIIESLLVDRGAPVSKGQALVKLDTSLEKAALQMAESRADMQGAVITRKVDLAMARLERQRLSDLYKHEMTAEKQRDEALAREKMASGALIEALENRKLQLLELLRTRQELDERTIHSPIDGVVVSQFAFPGELVFDQPIMSIAELSTLRVEVVLPARLYGSVREGDSFPIFPELQGDGQLMAAVDVVDPLLDAKSGTFGVRLLLDNSDLAIPSGQRCRVSFNTDYGASDYSPAVDSASTGMASRQDDERDESVGVTADGK